MSLVQIVCAVLVPLLWGYQFVAIKVGVVQFPPGAARNLGSPSRK